MKIQTWFDKIGDTIIWNKLPEYKQAIKDLPNGKFIVLIERVENVRSLEENNAMWGIPYMMFEAALIESGEFLNPSKKDIHNFCMVNCLPNDYRERIYKIWLEKPGVLNHKTGEIYKEPFRLTTTLLGKLEDWSNYYRNMQDFYAEYLSSGEKDLIPDPDKTKSKKYNNLLSHDAKVKRSPLTSTNLLAKAINSQKPL